LAQDVGVQPLLERRSGERRVRAGQQGVRLEEVALELCRQDHEREARIGTVVAEG
jgi:hypothetical protein